MADNKKYYYLKLKDNFFESDNIILLESMDDGYMYENILIKLYLKSLKDGGRLMLNRRIPYNARMIASVTRHQIGTVEKALEIFEQLELIEVLDNGTIYMLDIQNFIGESSTEADRKREYRARIEQEKELGQIEGTNVQTNERQVTGQITETNDWTGEGQMSGQDSIEGTNDWTDEGQMSGQTNGTNVQTDIWTNERQMTGQNSLEIRDKRIEIRDKRINKEKEYKEKAQRTVTKPIPPKKSTSRFIPPTAEEVKQYCLENHYSVDAQRFVDFYECKGWMVGKNKMKDWKAAVRTWVKRDKEGVKKDDPIKRSTSVQLW